METKRKILFLQEFSMERKGGGVSIIKRLVEKAAGFNYKVKIAYNRSANKELTMETGAQASFYTLPHNIRFGVGRILAYSTLFSLDIFALISIIRLIKKEEPDVVHITAHGVCFPVMVRAAVMTNKRIVLSVHDLWFFSVKNYMSKPVADSIFKKLVKKAGTVYVISREMKDYLTSECGEKNYQVVHDGVMHQAINKVLMPGTINLLYVGILHGMQIKQFNKLLEVLGRQLQHSFRIGICSAVEYMPVSQYHNITVVNYGWLSEDQVRKISLEYNYGLLPLSFEPEDELFYRTSLMTKIPFYTSVLLPIICIGPETASAVHLIQQEKIGMVAVSGEYEDISTVVKNITDQQPGSYQQYINKLKQSAATTFNIDLIAERFYKNLFPEVLNNGFNTN